MAYLSLPVASFIVVEGFDLPRTHITQQTISSLKATGERQFIRDDRIIGFGIRVSEKGRAVYFVETRVSGSRRNVRKQIGSVELVSLQDARQQARQLILAAKSGVDITFDPEPEEALPETLGGALKSFLETKRHKLRPSTIKDYQKTFNNCLEDWHRMPLHQVTRTAVRRKYLSLLDTKKPAYVNKVMRNLRSVLSFHGVNPNPVDIIKEQGLLAEVNPRDRFLSGQEIHDLIQVHRFYRGRYHTAILLMYAMTGLRNKELLNLRWRDVTDTTFTIHNTKNGKPHTMPLVPAIKDLMGERGNPDDLVFRLTESRLRRVVETVRAIMRSKQHWTIHDLRRTFSEHLSLIGYDVLEIAVANNQSSSSSVTQKHYLSGQLAKQSLLERMLTDLSKQYEYYYWDDGGDVRKVPDGWSPFDPEPELSQQEIEEGKKLYGTLDDQLDATDELF